MPKIPDLVNGGFISDDLKQLVQHDQIYGATDHWTKMAWYFKMNSSIGANAGILFLLEEMTIFMNIQVTNDMKNGMLLMMFWY